MTKRDPVQPKTTSKKSGSGGARSAVDKRRKHNWSAIRREYIRGDDTVTLATLAAKEGYPSKRELEKRCSAEDWVELRAEMARQVDGRLRALDLDLKTEVRARQAKVGKAFVALAVRGMAHLKPETLDAIDIARFAKVGAELERKALGMEELNVKVGSIRSPEDLDRLDEATLWKIAGMIPPDEDDDADF
ncbi:hypothetical protein SAMN04488058_101307 [Deinococcus reticulitermitis]|uniref:Uncharacterized protein n=1 Tax=Deinococcus reticulitermitis TaxID=856736 RepID=A0A1H6SHE3_9DEIO|nr:hypothetical protein [Deinococcus reticulitermitis]SEI67369.1 hypothetical protein SAMN04488058_101307 [Deinococcus reticulitermitis]